MVTVISVCRWRMPGRGWSTNLCEATTLETPVLATDHHIEGRVDICTRESLVESLPDSQHLHLQAANVTVRLGYARSHFPPQHTYVRVAQHTHSTCNNVRVVAPCTFPTTMHVTATNCLPIGNPIVQLQLRQQYYECCASANGRAIITLHRTDHILRLRQVSVTTVEVALRCQVTQRGRFCRFVCCHVVRCELCGFVGDAGHGLRKRKKRDKLGSESHLGLKS
jgi:hypothetical protein